MKETKRKIQFHQYRLRQAAGVYWLLDVAQPGFPYRRPLQMNEVGADIWKLLEAGCAEEDLVQKLLSEYEVDPCVLREDVEAFLQMLTQYGIRGEE